MDKQAKSVGLGHAHGKIILIGEHAVVYHQPAIALPFKEVSVRTTVLASDEMTVDCIYHSGLLADAPSELANLQAVVQKTLETIGHQDDRFHIRIDSEIPQERGMGSSAAVANATVRALYDYYGQTPDDETLFTLAQVSERIAHGNPSGLDAKVTVSDKPLYFIKDQGSDQFDISARGYLVVADTGEKGQTKLAVAALGEKKLENPSRIDDMITKLGVLSEQVRSYLRENNLRLMGEAMNESQTYLSEMGISNNSLDRLVLAARNAGALGSKLTGGGWGGCMLALVSDLGSAKRVQQALLDQAASQTWLLAFD